MSQEIWKTIHSLEGVYEASSEGRIRRAVVGRTTFPGRVLTGTGLPRYLAVTVHVDGKQLTRLVHRLVAEAFYGSCPSTKHQVNHKDGNIHNNRADNLEWVTPKQNRAHSSETLGASRGSRNPKCRIDESTALEVKSRYADGERPAQIARDLQLGYHTVFDICKGRTWTYPNTRAKKPDKYLV